jgi:ketosteroid isomerase-like protein
MNMNYEAIKAHYAASDRKDVAAMMAPITKQTVWTEMAGFPYAGT